VQTEEESDVKVYAGSEWGGRSTAKPPNNRKNIPKITPRVLNLNHLSVLDHFPLRFSKLSHDLCCMRKCMELERCVPPFKSDSKVATLCLAETRRDSLPSCHNNRQWQAGDGGLNINCQACRLPTSRKCSDSRTMADQSSQCHSSTSFRHPQPFEIPQYLHYIAYERTPWRKSCWIDLASDPAAHGCSTQKGLCLQ
jgi:hypothetical protein